MNKETKRLLTNVLVLIGLILVVVLAYFYFFSEEEDKLLIEETEIQIESVRTIAEISTVSFRDEVVMDTVEMYDTDHGIYDPRKWKEWYDHDVKRRLTLIIKGEVKYGFDLTDDNYSLKSDETTVTLLLPAPTIIDIIVSPSQTEVFEEKGKWDESVRRNMEIRAKKQIEKSAKNLRLEDKAKNNAERLFEKLIQTDKILIIEFEDNE
jgi:hypothetical protein